MSIEPIPFQLTRGNRIGAETMSGTETESVTRRNAADRANEGGK